MIRVLIGFVAIAALAVVAVWVADQSGNVSVTVGGWRIDTSFGVALGLLILLVLALLVLDRVWVAVRGAPHAFGRRRARHRLDHGYHAVAKGMAALAAGDSRDAMALAERAQRLLPEDDGLAGLLAAQAAHQAGNEADAEQRFRAMLDNPDTRFVGLRGLTVSAYRAGRRTDAIETAERAHRLRPNAPWPVRALLFLQIAERRWADALATLQSGLKHNVLDKEEARRKRAVLNMAQARSAEEGGAGDEALKHAEQALKLAPELVPAAALVAELQHGRGKTRRALQALEAAWRVAPHPALTAGWLALHGTEAPDKLMAQAESFAALQPGDDEAQMLLAQAALRAGDPAAAKAALEKVQHPTRRVVRLQAAAEEAAGAEPEEVRRLLERAAAPPPLGAPPDPVWNCSDCGRDSTEWAALCPSCGAFDTMGWGAPKGPVPQIQSRPVAELGTPLG
ncbi:MAG: heme biosynthesis HemY N-terminal domain-containing protein [Sneathiellaceae bacterium]